MEMYDDLLGFNLPYGFLLVKDRDSNGNPRYSIRSGKETDDEGEDTYKYCVWITEGGTANSPFGEANEQCPFFRLDGNMELRGVAVKEEMNVLFVSMDIYLVLLWIKYDNRIYQMNVNRAVSDEDDLEELVDFLNDVLASVRISGKRGYFKKITADMITSESSAFADASAAVNHDFSDTKGQNGRHSGREESETSGENADDELENMIRDLENLGNLAAEAGYDLNKEVIGDTGFDMYDWTFSEGKREAGKGWSIAIPDGFAVIKSKEKGWIDRPFEVVPQGMEDADSFTIPVRILPGVGMESEALHGDMRMYHPYAREGAAENAALLTAKLLAKTVGKAPEITSVAFDDICAYLMIQDTSDHSYSYQCQVLSEGREQGLRVQTQFIWEAQKKALTRSILNWLKTFRFDEPNAAMPKEAPLESLKVLNDLKNGRVTSFNAAVDQAHQEYQVAIHGKIGSLQLLGEYGMLNQDTPDTVKEILTHGNAVMEFYYQKADELVEKLKSAQVKDGTMKAVYNKLRVFEEAETEFTVEDKKVTVDLPAKVKEIQEKWKSEAAKIDPNVETPEDIGFPSATPQKGQHTQLDCMSHANDRLSLLGISVNQSGAEYEFEPIGKTAECVDGNASNAGLTAIYRKIAESDSGDFDLVETAHDMAELFRVNADVFDGGHDREQEILGGYIQRAAVYNKLRSFAWTLYAYCNERKVEPADLEYAKIEELMDFIESRGGLNYTANSFAPTLCSGNDIFVYYIPDAVSDEDRQVLWESLNKDPDGNPKQLIDIKSLDGLRVELSYMYPAIRAIYDELEATRNRDKALEGGTADILYAWCSMTYAAREPISSEDGPMNFCWEHPDNLGNYGTQWRIQRCEEQIQTGQEWVRRHSRDISQNAFISVQGRSFVFAGTGSLDELPDIRKRLTEMGGVERNSVSGKTDYLVCNPEAAGEAKIKNALEQRRKGSNIKIVLLEDFLKAIGITVKTTQDRIAELKESMKAAPAEKHLKPVSRPNAKPAQKAADKDAPKATANETTEARAEGKTLTAEAGSREEKRQPEADRQKAEAEKQRKQEEERKTLEANRPRTFRERQEERRLNEARDRAAKAQFEKELEKWYSDFHATRRKREKQFEERFAAEKVRLETEAKDKYDSVVSAKNAELSILAKQKSDAEAELAALGFFKFGEKKEKKAIIESAAAKIHDANVAIYTAKREYEAAMAKVEQTVCSREQAIRNAVEQENPFPVQPEVPDFSGMVNTIDDRKECWDKIRGTEVLIYLSNGEVHTAYEIGQAIPDFGSASIAHRIAGQLVDAGELNCETERGIIKRYRIR